MACKHANTYSLYRRAPRSAGGGFVPDAQRCADCFALMERGDAGDRRLRTAIGKSVLAAEQAATDRRLALGRKMAKRQD